VYSQKYGTFLGNCERDREALRLSALTESVWTEVLMDRFKFTNKFYNPAETQRPIVQIPVISYFCHSEWREFFFKWTTKGYLAGNLNVRRPTYI